MSDAELRALERAWLASPADLELQARWTAALQRSGRQVPPWAVDHLRYPATTFDPGRPFGVWGELPDLERSERKLGISALGEAVEVPEHHAWWIRAQRVGKALPEFVQIVRDHGVPGLKLDRAHLNAEKLRVLRDVPSLTRLSLAGCRRLDAGALDVIAEQLPQLRHLDLSFTPARVKLEARHLDAWPELAHLRLRHSGGDREARLIARHAPQLTRLRIGGPRLSGAGLNAIARLPWLSRLEVGFAPRIERGSLGGLTELPRLLHLDLIACPGIEGEDLAQLMEADALASLGFFPPAIQPWIGGREANTSELAGLAELTQLERLCVSSNPGLGSSLIPAWERAELEGALEDCEVNYRASPVRRDTLDEFHWRGPPVGRGLLPRG